MGPMLKKKERESDGDKESKNPYPCEADTFRHWDGTVAGEFRIEPDLIWISIFSDDQ